MQSRFHLWRQAYGSHFDVAAVAEEHCAFLGGPHSHSFQFDNGFGYFFAAYSQLPQRKVLAVEDEFAVGALDDQQFLLRVELSP